MRASRKMADDERDYVPEQSTSKMEVQSTINQRPRRSIKHKFIKCATANEVAAPQTSVELVPVIKRITVDAIANNNFTTKVVTEAAAEPTNNVQNPRLVRVTPRRDENAGVHQQQSEFEEVSISEFDATSTSIDNVEANSVCIVRDDDDEFIENTINTDDIIEEIVDDTNFDNVMYVVENTTDDGTSIANSVEQIDNTVDVALDSTTVSTDSMPVADVGDAIIVEVKKTRGRPRRKRVEEVESGENKYQVITTDATESNAALPMEPMPGRKTRLSTRRSTVTVFDAEVGADYKVPETEVPARVEENVAIVDESILENKQVELNNLETHTVTDVETFVIETPIAELAAVIDEQSAEQIIVETPPQEVSQAIEETGVHPSAECTSSKREHDPVEDVPMACSEETTNNVIDGNVDIIVNNVSETSSTTVINQPISNESASFDAKPVDSSERDSPDAECNVSQDSTTPNGLDPITLEVAEPDEPNNVGDEAVSSPPQTHSPMDIEMKDAVDVLPNATTEIQGKLDFLFS